MFVNFTGQQEKKKSWAYDFFNIFLVSYINSIIRLLRVVAGKKKIEVGEWYFLSYFYYKRCLVSGRQKVDKPNNILYSGRFQPSVTRKKHIRAISG